MQAETPFVSCKAAGKVLWSRPSVVICSIYFLGFYGTLYSYGFVSCRPGGKMWELISSYEGGDINMSSSWLAVPLRLLGGVYADFADTCTGTRGGQRTVPLIDYLVCLPSEDVRADEPYITFKTGFSSAMALAGGFLASIWLAERQWGTKGRVWAHVVFGAIMLIVAHGILGSLTLVTLGFATSSISVLVRKFITSSRDPQSLFALASVGPAQVCIWIFTVGCMEIVFRFLGDYGHKVDGWQADEGFKFWSLLEELVCGEDALSQPIENGQVCWLSRPLVIKGVVPWFLFRLSALKFVSFSMDKLWSLHEVPSGVREINTKPELIQRVETHLRPEAYSLKYYVAYLGYMPLFGSGPVLSYNAFVSQIESPQQTYSKRHVLFYGCRILFYMIVFEIFAVAWWYSQKLTQFTCEPGGPYPGCIFDDLSVWELYLAMHVRLQFSWMSLTIIWRLFRFLALLGGVDSPENMLECPSFQYSFEAFWRVWHASMNRFILRYLYSPLGGKRRTWLAVPIVFTFVAYWHENTGFGTHRFWYMWGLFNAIGVTLEKAFSDIVGKKLIASARKGNLLAQGLCFSGRGITCIFLIFANVPPIYGEYTGHFYRSFVLRGWDSAAMLVAVALAWSCCNYVAIAMREDASAPSASDQQSLKHGTQQANAMELSPAPAALRDQSLT